MVDYLLDTDRIYREKIELIITIGCGILIFIGCFLCFRYGYQFKKTLEGRNETGSSTEDSEEEAANLNI